MGLLNKPGFSGCRRLSGGASRTRTNHQSVMEHGWCPTNYPGRTPFRIARASAHNLCDRRVSESKFDHPIVSEWKLSKRKATPRKAQRRAKTKTTRRAAQAENSGTDIA